MLAAFNELIERRIDEARRQGAFDGLPGAGRKLLALAVALESRGAALTTGAGLAYRRTLLERFDRESA